MMKNVKKTAGLLQEIGAKNSPTDTILAHITPNEAAMLKANGGSGRRDPNTGLPHFEDDDSSYQGSWGGFSGSGWGEDSGDAYSTGGISDGYSNVGGWGGASGDAYGLSPYGSNGQSYEPMYPAQYKTLGGTIANYFGFDPQGTGARVGDIALNALGMFNPVAGAAAKIGQYAARNSSSDMPAPMLAKQNQPSMLGDLTKQAMGMGAGMMVGNMTGNATLAELASTLAKNTNFTNGKTQDVPQDALSRSGGSSSEQTMAALPDKVQKTVQAAQTYGALPFSGGNSNQNNVPFDLLKYGYRRLG